MRNHTTPKIWELSGPQGKSISLTPGASSQTATYQFTNIPTGKDGKFWYYCTGIVLAVQLTIDNSNGAASTLPNDLLWQSVASIQVQSPTLGTIFTHANYRGVTAGLITNPYGMGFANHDKKTAVPASGAANVRTLYYRLPFALEFLRKPHEISPWGGFFEGGTLELKTAPNTVLQGASTGSSITNVTVRCWMEFIPSPEAVIHTPFHIREHNGLPGNTVRHTITDMGAPDGLQGINQGVGVGIGALLYLTNATNTGLNGAGTATNILSYDITWRDQTRIDSPDAPFEAFFAHSGVRSKNVTNTSDASGFPYLDSADVTAAHNATSSAIFVPFVTSGRDLETSKLQTVAGAKDINVTYTSTPSNPPVFLGMYFPTFDEGYVRNVLAPKISPSTAGQAAIVAKTLNKQTGGVYGVGKLAYVRQKIK